MPAYKYKCIVNMKINNVVTQVLIDTGATSSAISTKLLECFPNSKRKIYRRTPKVCLAVNGQPLKSLYTVMLPITLKGGKCLYHEFEVINGLINPVLLGTDFLKAQEAKLDFADNSLQLGKEILHSQIAEWSPPQPAHLTVFENTVLPPNSISLVRAEIAGEDPTLTNKIENMLIGPLSTKFDTDFIASYSIIDPNSPEIWIEVLNPLDNAIHLPQGQAIADVEGLNSEFCESELSRDLRKMPSDLSERGDSEDFCDGFRRVFDDQNGSYANEFQVDPPDANFTPVFSDSLFASCDSSDCSHSPSLDTPKETPSRCTPVEMVEVEDVENISESTFVPKALLTKQGLITIKPQYETLFGLEPENDQTDHPINNDTSSDPPLSDNPEEFKPNTDNTILEGEDLTKLKSIIEEFSDVFATHAEDIGRTTLLQHHTTLTTDKPVSASYYRAPPPHVRAQIDRETDRLLAAGVL